MHTDLLQVLGDTKNTSIVSQEMNSAASGTISVHPCSSVALRLSVRAARMTRASWAMNNSATAAPIPRDAPVTRATRP
jgi:hypothetical protein